MRRRLVKGSIVATLAALALGPALAGAVPAGSTVRPWLSKGFNEVDVPGARQTWLYGIAPSGQAFGRFKAENGAMMAFVDSDGHFLLVGDPSAGPVGSYTVGVDTAGAVVGGYVDTAGMSHGFSLSDLQYTELNDPLAGAGAHAGTVVTSVNAGGSIAGYWVNRATGTHGFIESGGSYRTVSFVAKDVGTLATELYGISKNGTVVGYAVVNATTRCCEGFIFHGGTFQVVRDPRQPAGGATALTGIAPTSGETVGVWWKHKAYGSAPFGFRLVKGTFHALSDPAGARGTTPEGVTDAGLVAGYYLDASGRAHGFIWEP